MVKHTQTIHWSVFDHFVRLALKGLRIVTGKKHRQMKLQRLQKVQIWAFGLLVQQINSL